MRGVLALATALALAACQQTVHLFPSPPDGGPDGGPTTTGKGGAGGKTDAGAPDAHCFGAGPPLVFTADKPQMVIALDRSTGMNQSFGMYSQLQTALNALLAEFYDYADPPHQDHPAISYWFTSFPDDDNGSCQPQTGCCAADVTTSWQAFAGRVSGCASPSNMCVTSANRPIATALAKADATLGALPASSSAPRHVVLITGGSPSGSCGGPTTDCMLAETAAHSLSMDDAKIWIVAFGDQGACLANLPTSGGHSYTVYTDNDLYSALDQIMANAVCSVTLTNPPASTANLQVYVGPNFYPNGATDGWTYDNGRLRLHGALCDAYAQYGGLVVSNGCGSGHGGGGPP